MTTTTQPSPDEAAAIRAAIETFLRERLQPKLDAAKHADEDQRRAIAEPYQPENWIPAAAARASQIQLVTHAIKYSHPDAKGTSLSSHGNSAAGNLEVGSHTLRGAIPSDVVGNAAALDVYKFLRLEVNGRTLLDRALTADPGLTGVLPGDVAQVQEWIEAFAGLAKPKGTPASHPLAKQLYWPLPEGGYHLLAPLFSSSLAHRVWTQIREDRFSDAAKAAREAYHHHQPHPVGYCEYPHMAIRKFGGTKPQNISQLNSERHGENYLLASVPPNWNGQGVRPPLNRETIFDRSFGSLPSVRGLTSTLRNFLLGVSDWTNQPIRAKRAELVALIRDELIQYAAAIQNLPPGWSADPACRLVLEERHWLDPQRALTDPEFAAERAAKDWRAAIAGRFARWLNARLGSKKTSLGDPEFGAWRAELLEQLQTLPEELEL